MHWLAVQNSPLGQFACTRHPTQMEVCVSQNGAVCEVQSGVVAQALMLPQVLLLRQCWPAAQCESVVHCRQVRSVGRQCGVVPLQSASVPQPATTTWQA